MLEVNSKLTDRHLVKKAPAPWNLSGEAVILMYKFNKAWVEEHGMLPAHLKGKFKGGLGCVILVNYSSSPVGPFQELIFMPGKFRKSKMQAITKIYTDSEPSAINGQKNWGLPKEILPMIWEKSRNWDQISLYQRDHRVFSLEVETKGVSIPISTVFFPIQLCQTWNNLKYFTNPMVTGWGKFAKIKNLDLDPNCFPDIRLQKPLFALKVNPFNLELPDAIFKDEVGKSGLFPHS